VWLIWNTRAVLNTNRDSWSCAYTKTNVTQTSECNAFQDNRLFMSMFTGSVTFTCRCVDSS
jgi:hypothetical protein